MAVSSRVDIFPLSCHRKANKETDISRDSFRIRKQRSTIPIENSFKERVHTRYIHRTTLPRWSRYCAWISVIFPIYTDELACEISIRIRWMLVKVFHEHCHWMEKERERERERDKDKKKRKEKWLPLLEKFQKRQSQKVQHKIQQKQDKRNDRPMNNGAFLIKSTIYLIQLVLLLLSTTYRRSLL